jgi:hypothetical protein
MKKKTTYPWRAAFVSAVLEIDDAKVDARIDEATAAMNERREEGSNIEDTEDRALAMADVGIQALRTERWRKTIRSRSTGAAATPEPPRSAVERSIP